MRSRGVEALGCDVVDGGGVVGGYWLIEGVWGTNEERSVCWWGRKRGPNNAFATWTIEGEGGKEERDE